MDLDFLQFVAELTSSSSLMELSPAAARHGEQAPAQEVESSSEICLPSPENALPSSECHHSDAPSSTDLRSEPVSKVPSWDPIPTVPEFHRQELTVDLAEGLELLSPGTEQSTLHLQGNIPTGARELTLPADNFGIPSVVRDDVEQKRATNRAKQRSFRQKQK